MNTRFKWSYLLITLITPLMGENVLGEACITCFEPLTLTLPSLSNLEGWDKSGRGIDGHHLEITVTSYMGEIGGGEGIRFRINGKADEMNYENFYTAFENDLLEFSKKLYIKNRDKLKDPTRTSVKLERFRISTPRYQGRTRSITVKNIDGLGGFILVKINIKAPLNNCCILL
jgi:hypothetical protein